MMEIKGMFKKYNSIIDNNIDIYTDRIKSLKDKREYLYSLLLEYKEILKDSKFNFDEVERIRVKASYRKSVTVFHLKDINIEPDKLKLLNVIASNYIRINNLIYVCEQTIKEQNNIRVPFDIYKIVIEEYNNYVSSEVLRGKCMELGFKLGGLSIKKVKRNCDESNSPSIKNINWGESNKLKQLIIDSGKVPYNKDTAPDGEHWIVRHVEDSCWWWLNKGVSYIANYILYRFVPTNAINTAKRSQIDFANNAKSIDEIIDSPLLGNRDKLNILLRFDNTYHLNFDYAK